MNSQEKNKSEQAMFSKHQWLADILLGISGAFVLLLLRGYLFPTSNHGQELPPIMALLNQNLFENDLAVQSFLEPGPRWVYQKMIAGLVSHTPLSLAGSYFVLHLASIISISVALVRLARGCMSQMRISDQKSAHGLWVLILFAAYLPMHSWGSPLSAAAPVPSVFAMGIAIWSLPLALSNRWIFAFALLGIAASLQFLVGLLLGSVLLPGLIAYAYQSGRLRTAAASISIWGACLSAIYLPMAITALPTPEDFDFLTIFGLYRVPHHWVPSTAPPTAWISDIALWAAGAFALFTAKKSETISDNALITLGGILAVSAIGIVANWVFVEIIPVEFIGKLQFQRIMPFGQLAAHLAVFGALIATRRTFLLMLLTITLPLYGWPCIALATVVLAQWFTGQPRKKYTGILILAIIMLFVLVVFPSDLWIFVQSGLLGALLLTSVVAAEKHTTGKGSMAMIAALSAPVILILTLALTPQIYDRAARMLSPTIPSGAVEDFLARKWSLDITPHLPGTQISDAARKHVPHDAVVLTAPTWDRIPTMFSYLSERAVFYSHKNVPYTNHGVWEWSERGKALLGTELTPFMTRTERHQAFSRRTTEDILKITETNKICYTLLPDSPARDIPGDEIAAEVDRGVRWALTRLPGCA